MQTGNAEKQQTDDLMIFIVRQLSWSPKILFFFRMMESASGIKGMFVSVTAGVLECLVTLLSLSTTKM